MADLEIDISDYRSKPVDEFLDTEFDVVVTLTEKINRFPALSDTHTELL